MGPQPQPRSVAGSHRQLYSGVGVVHAFRRLRADEIRRLLAARRERLARRGTGVDRLRIAMMSAGAV
jgi:hypothetical protein